MHPIELRIPGEYWDTQLYKGRLILFGRDGSIRSLDWDKLITSLNMEADLVFAIECAFRRSEYLYKKEWKLIFNDPELFPIIKQKFKRLSKIRIDIGHAQLDNATIKQYDSPFPHPHADTDIYHEQVYVVSRSGLFSSPFQKKHKHTVSRSIERLWDCPAFSVVGSYNSLVMSAGEEGVFEYPLLREDDAVDLDTNNIKNIYPDHSSRSTWNYHSVYSSSILSSGCLIAFNNIESDHGYDDSIKQRVFDRLIKDEELFNNLGYTWGERDKVYLVANNEIQPLRYNPWSKEEESIFIPLPSIKLSPWKGNVISAGTSYFGTVIECDNAIVVVRSDSKTITFKGEPVNWRVFPRSIYYTNHLHVVYNSYVKIISFNHDYFIKQGDKRVGIKYTSPDRLKYIK